jgi:hypothetical protein
VAAPSPHSPHRRRCRRARASQGVGTVPPRSPDRPGRTAGRYRAGGVAADDGQAVQFGGQGVEQLLAVGGAVLAAQPVLGDVATDEPVAECKAGVDCPTGLSGQLGTDPAVGADEPIEGEATHGAGGSLGLALRAKPNPSMTGPEKPSSCTNPPGGAIDWYRSTADRVRPIP